MYDQMNPIITDQRLVIYYSKGVKQAAESSTMTKR